VLAEIGAENDAGQSLITISDASATADAGAGPNIYNWYTGQPPIDTSSLPASPPATELLDITELQEQLLTLIVRGGRIDHSAHVQSGCAAHVHRCPGTCRRRSFGLRRIGDD
jgi:hypothetical protein